MVNGCKVRAYDNGGKTCDRYTVVYMDCPTTSKGIRYYDCIGMDESPFHPQGIGMHGEACIGTHLGKRVSIKSLPTDCIKAVIQDCAMMSPAIHK